jgi:hypothetical protein
MPLKKQRSMPPEAAEALAIQALTFVGRDPTELGRFLALTGIGPAELRQVAHEPGFLVGVFDYILGHEPTLIAFAEDAGLQPFDVALAREVLGGTRWERDLP